MNEATDLQKIAQEPFKISSDQILQLEDDGSVGTPGQRKQALADSLNEYVAPPFEGGADYEEVHVDGRNEFETVVMFDENDEVTIDPVLARIEAERVPSKEEEDVE